MIIINPAYKDIRKWLIDIPTAFDKHGEVIYNKRNCIKRMMAPDSTIVYVKRYHTPQGINRLVYSLGIRKPKGLRAYIYPQTLIAKGINTPLSIAYIEERQNGLLGYSYFISTECRYEHTMYEIIKTPDNLSVKIAIHLARFTANMHEKGVMHLDYSPGNILWDKDENGYHFAIVDINRMYFGKINMRQGSTNFKRLWGSKRFFITLIDEYSRVRNFPVDKTEAFALSARVKFWKRYIRKHSVPFEPEL